MRLASIATAAVFVLFVRQVSAAGFERATVPDPMDKPLEVAIWYPSAAPISQQRDNPAGQSLALDGPINGEHLPLIVVSYGNGGSSDSHADTALALADAGFVVAAVTHTGDNYRDESYPASRWMVDRPRHIRLVLDYLLRTRRVRGVQFPSFRLRSVHHRSSDRPHVPEIHLDEDRPEHRDRFHCHVHERHPHRDQVQIYSGPFGLKASTATQLKTGPATSR